MRRLPPPLRHSLLPRDEAAYSAGVVQRTSHGESVSSLLAGQKQRLVLVLASLLLSVLLGLLLSRQGRVAETPQRHKLRIGLSFDTLKEERWQRDRAAFVERAKQLGAEVIDLAANSSDVQQMRDVESLLTAQVNLLVIVAHNGAAMSKAVRLALCFGDLESEHRSVDWSCGAFTGYACHLVLLVPA